MQFRLWLWSVVLGFGVAANVIAEDWPRWRGPDLNGISRETGWLGTWPKEGPKQVWKAKVDPGFSTVTVAKGRVYTTGSAEKKETIYCLEETSGKVLWKHTFATKFVPEYYEGGSSGTPTVDGDRIYHLGQMGELFCFDTAGKVIWSNNVVTATGTKQPTWGLTGAPFVQGATLILNVGATGAALDKKTGKVLWSSKGEGGYATAVPFKGGLLMMGTKELAHVDGTSGSVHWKFPWPTMYDVNAADPVIVGSNQVFISSGYNHGGALLEIQGAEPKVVWQNKSMRNHFNASVLLNGHLFGIDGDAGRNGSGVACIEAATGKEKWREPKLGSGGLMAAENKLIILSEKGELVIAEASGDAFKPLARAQVMGGKIWTVPVLANGKIFCRNSTGNLACIDPSGK